MTEPTACPVGECDSAVDYTALYDHLYNAHDESELCATVTNLVAENWKRDREIVALRGSVRAAQLTVKHGDMTEDTRQQLTDALDPDA